MKTSRTSPPDPAEGQPDPSSSARLTAARPDDGRARQDGADPHESRPTDRRRRRVHLNRLDAVAHQDRTVGVAGHPRLVGHHEHGGALLLRRVDEQLHDLVGADRVERAGGLVGEDHPRLRRPAPGRARPAGPARRTARPGSRSPSPSRPSRVSQSAARGQGLAVGAARPSSSGSAMFSSTGSSGTSWPNWKTKPKAVRRRCTRCAVGRAGRCAGRRSAPRRGRGCRMPARQCSSVDLPEPLGPITATISPCVDGDAGAAQRGREPVATCAAHARPAAGSSRTSSARAARRASAWSSQRRSASMWNSW